MSHEPPIYALACSGGGALGAYQLGVLKHIHREIATAPVVSLGGHRSHTLRSTSAADAVLEAYVLAHCKKIWGTYGSSFSALASRWLPRPRGSFELMRVSEAG